MSSWVGWDPSESAVGTASGGIVGSAASSLDKMDNMVHRSNDMENEENEMRMRNITKMMGAPCLKSHKIGSCEVTLLRHFTYSFSGRQKWELRSALLRQHLRAFLGA